jgi:RHS repeat-associated protein
VAATDEQGNVIWREDYQPYGGRIDHDPAANNNTRWFTGHPHDEASGLTYMGARWYDPTVGRFMGVDPKNFSSGNLHSFNRYGYGNNNPYRYVDPDGRSPIDERLRNAMGLLPDAGFGPGGGAAYGRFAFRGPEAFKREVERLNAEKMERALAKGAPPPNMSPPGAGRQGAFNEAKRARGIPTSQQPDRTLPNTDARGNLQPGRVYEYDIPAPGGGIRTEKIRDDAAGHVYTDNPSQNRGPHFNDAAKKHYDY